MYLVTNRSLDENAKGIARLGTAPSEQGPNELRLVEATKRGRAWEITILPDKLLPEMKDELPPEMKAEDPVYASRYVAAKLLERVRKDKKHLLVFVHGYNNDIKAVLDRAERLEKRYNVEVLAFSWPAHGGGVRGTLSYKSDKRDARASTGAFERVLMRIHEYLTECNQELMEKSWQAARKKFPDDVERRDQHFADLIAKGCPFTVNLMLHSMGNYLYKHMLLSTANEGNQLTFDNVVLVAADTNNLDHALWVDKILCRKAVYITINENDSALGLSRMKLGEAQLARLGHTRHNLEARQALYIDFTDAPAVGNSHSYFEGDPVKNANAAVTRFFRKAFTGERAEEDLEFAPATGMYRFRLG